MEASNNLLEKSFKNNEVWNEKQMQPVLDVWVDVFPWVITKKQFASALSIAAIVPLVENYMW